MSKELEEMNYYNKDGNILINGDTINEMDNLVFNGEDWAVKP